MRKIPGPTKPIHVISLRTDNTLHLLKINLSAKCPAPEKLFESIALILNNQLTNPNHTIHDIRNSREA